MIFAFKASNNQAEYKALLAGMLLAKEMGSVKFAGKERFPVGYRSSDRGVPSQGSVDGRVPGVRPSLEDYVCGV